MFAQIFKEDLVEKLSLGKLADALMVSEATFGDDNSELDKFNDDLLSDSSELFDDINSSFDAEDNDLIMDDSLFAGDGEKIDESITSVADDTATPRIDNASSDSDSDELIDLNVLTSITRSDNNPLTEEDLLSLSNEPSDLTTFQANFSSENNEDSLFNKSELDFFSQPNDDEFGSDEDTLESMTFDDDFLQESEDDLLSSMEEVAINSGFEQLSQSSKAHENFDAEQSKLIEGSEEVELLGDDSIIEDDDVTSLISAVDSIEELQTDVDYNLIDDDDSELSALKSFKEDNSGQIISAEETREIDCLSIDMPEESEPNNDSIFGIDDSIIADIEDIQVDYDESHSVTTDSTASFSDTRLESSEEVYMEDNISSLSSLEEIDENFDTDETILSDIDEFSSDDKIEEIESLELLDGLPEESLPISDDEISSIDDVTFAEPLSDDLSELEGDVDALQFSEVDSIGQFDEADSTPNKIDDIENFSMESGSISVPEEFPEDNDLLDFNDSSSLIPDDNSLSVLESFGEEADDKIVNLEGIMIESADEILSDAAPIEDPSDQIIETKEEPTDSLKFSDHLMHSGDEELIDLDSFTSESDKPNDDVFGTDVWDEITEESILSFDGGNDDTVISVDADHNKNNDLEDISSIIVGSPEDEDNSEFIFPFDDDPGSFINQVTQPENTEAGSSDEEIKLMMNSLNDIGDSFTKQAESLDEGQPNLLSENNLIESNDNLLLPNFTEGVDEDRSLITGSFSDEEISSDVLSENNLDVNDDNLLLSNFTEDIDEDNSLIAESSAEVNEEVVTDFELSAFESIADRPMENIPLKANIPNPPISETSSSAPSPRKLATSLNKALPKSSSKQYRSMEILIGDFRLPYISLESLEKNQRIPLRDHKLKNIKIIIDNTEVGLGKIIKNKITGEFEIEIL